jgi:hypothetical protein
MKVVNTWILYSDLADLLEQEPCRLSITTDSVLNQLHALICVRSSYSAIIVRRGLGNW